MCLLNGINCHVYICEFVMRDMCVCVSRRGNVTDANSKRAKFMKILVMFILSFILVS